MTFEEDIKKFIGQKVRVVLQHKRNEERKMLYGFLNDATDEGLTIDGVFYPYYVWMIVSWGIRSP